MIYISPPITRVLHAVAVGAICAVFSAVAFVHAATAQSESSDVGATSSVITITENSGTDQEALAVLLREAAEEAALAASSACGVGPLLLHIEPAHAPAVLRQVFSEELMKRGIAVRTGVDGAQAGDFGHGTLGHGAGHGTRCRLTVEVRGLRSSAVSSGNSSYFRKIEATLGLLIEEHDGTVAYSRERLLERSDTLPGDAPYSARSYLDDGTSWWGGLLEPALVTATAIVIAILLFTVRGSS